MCPINCFNFPYGGKVIYFATNPTEKSMRASVLCGLLLLLCSCNKTIDVIAEKESLPSSASKLLTASGFTLYTIKSGQHFVSNNYYQPIETSELKFAVRFDSSAIYQSLAPVNQYDINKLYGFSDNNADHHQFSARFGWAWNNGALRLYAYVYNDGKVTSKELGVIAIGTEVVCSIKVRGNAYIFSCNDQALVMPRHSTIPKAKGYLLYPYFGGDEAAPHDINVWIKTF
jgi:hypothetical protein